MRGAYLVAMPADPEVRRQRWAQFVRRALAHAHTTRGWTVPRVAEAAGIGSNTIYRWRDARGIKAPLPEQVVAFCDALDIPVEQAFRILWPGKNGVPEPTPPPPLDDTILTIARKLADPHVPDREKWYLRESLRELADRPSQPESARPLRRQRG